MGRRYFWCNPAPAFVPKSILNDVTNIISTKAKHMRVDDFPPVTVWAVPIASMAFFVNQRPFACYDGSSTPQVR